MATHGRDRKAKRQVIRTVVVIAIVVAMAFVLFQTSPLIRNSTEPVRAGMDDLVVQTSSAIQAVELPSFESAAELQRRIEALEIENRQLAIWRDTATSMTERLHRYEELLDLVGEPIPNGVSARVVTETDGPFAETRLANAGDLQGVEEGFVAVNTQGVIGRVIRVGQRSSRILLVNDFNSRVPVMGEISGVRAILAGGRGDQYGALVDNPEQADFISGETLVTSGEGNAFPRGIRIGRAVRVEDEWLAQLALGEAPVDFVRLLPAMTIPSPEDEPAIEVEEPRTEIASEPVADQGGQL
tara:strand:- start:18642 stop:19538 length:897 start_codon:yes stop_codon:yes gene_type:complete